MRLSSQKLIYIREVMSSKLSIRRESVSKGHINSGHDSSLERVGLLAAFGSFLGGVFLFGIG